jgi:Cof subfamily protein (haloacid dehalogenase superfamily)
VTEKRYKLLVVDIDGTLLDKNANISIEDKDALSRARDAGLQVSLSTGRVVKAALPYINQLSVDAYHMFFDGALVYNPEKDEEVYVEPISKDLVRQMIDFSRQVGLDFDLYSVTHFFAERETWATDIRRDFFKLEPTIVDFTEIWQKERMIKGTLVVRSAEEKARANDFYLHFKDSLNFSWTITPAYPDVDFINVITHDVSKGKALEALTSFLRISLSDVIAIGDGVNDIPLLTSAGMAIAMDNASDELKAVADYVTLDVDHHGVAEAIYKFLL